MILQTHLFSSLHSTKPRKIQTRSLSFYLDYHFGDTLQFDPVPEYHSSKKFKPTPSISRPVRGLQAITISEVAMSEMGTCVMTSVKITARESAGKSAT
jgi:hypothetical protein